MKKAKQFLALFGLGLFLFSCNPTSLSNEASEKVQENITQIEQYLTAHQLPVKKTQSGVYYAVTTANPTGKVVTVGDQIVFHYVETLLDGTKIDSSSVSTNAPGKIAFGVSYDYPAAAVVEALSYLHVGEKASFFLPSNLAYGSQSSSLIPPYAVLRFDVNVLAFNSEDTQIDNYVASNNLTVTEKTASGLRYIRTAASTGAALTSGQTVSVTYSGKLLSTGAKFDSGTFSFVLGGSSTIKGFDEGIGKMKVGESATLIFPSSIGYGTVGSGTIPPYAPLVFDITVTGAK